MSAEQTKFEGIVNRLTSHRLADVPVADLANGPQYPNAQLRNQIDGFGIAQAVTLFERPDGEPKYEIAAGHRRIMVARELGIETIPAIIYGPENIDLLPGVRLMLNSNQTPDPFGELAWIMSLQEAGFDEKAIGMKTGFGATKVAARLKLATLHPDLQLGVRRNRIALNVAEKAATLPADQQDELCNIFAEKDRLVMKDVTEVIDQHSDAPEHQVSFSVSDDWRKHVRKAVVCAKDQGVHVEVLVDFLRAEFGDDDGADVDDE